MIWIQKNSLYGDKRDKRFIILLREALISIFRKIKVLLRGILFSRIISFTRYTAVVLQYQTDLHEIHVFQLTVHKLEIGCSQIALRTCHFTQKDYSLSEPSQLSLITEPRLWEVFRGLKLKTYNFLNKKGL